MAEDPSRARRRLPILAPMCAAIAIELAGSVPSAVSPRALATLSADDPPLQTMSVVLDKESIRIGVPDGWRRVQDGARVLFAPADGHAAFAGKPRVTRGVELGIAPVMATNFGVAFDEIVGTVQSINPELRSASITRLLKLAGRMGMRGTFDNTSPATRGPEYVIIAAAPIEGRRVVYMLGVGPSEQWTTFRPTLEAILASIAIGR
jgi:hypothetical protein